MTTFSYKAIDETGTRVTGTMEAKSWEEVSDRLVGQGYIPFKVKVKKAALPFSWEELSLKFTRIKTRELILFTKQLQTMMRAGIPIVQIFQTMEVQTENPLLKKTIARIREDIVNGESLYNSFRKYPRIFSELYCSMIRSGETAGSLPEVLERLSYILEHEDKVRSEVKGAMFYPVIVILFLALAFFILLTFVIPKFATLFQSAGVTLPLPTRIAIALQEFIWGYWFFLASGLIMGLILLVRFFKTDRGKLLRDTYLLKAPIIGGLLQKTAMSRFSSIFAILQTSGVSILESFQILTNTIGNTAIAKEFAELRDKLEEGQGISGPLQATHYFPPMVINMVAIGEESGNLDEMLQEISSHYDYEVEYATQRLSEAIGPILTIGLAAIIGFFAFSIFLPMWNMIQTI
ncbi:MAG: type II secretion system F family protein [Desulfurivibrionaceae bacterium]